MISADALRDYHRQLALYCLDRADACTAGELVEQMGMASMGTGHPDECWRGLTTPMVSGLMRELDGQRLVERRDNKHNPRHGRMEAVWGLRIGDTAAVRAMPAPPATSATGLGAAPAPAAAAPAPHRAGGLTIAQKLALVNVEFQEMQARQLAEWNAFQVRAARMLKLEGESA